jgi:eukaryotic-like serine/threonine-protein kinase
MNWDQTQPQSAGDIHRAKQLSLQMDSQPQIAGYRIERPIGSGAYGQVWLAIDLNTGRPVAIKCYLNRANLDLKELEREVSLLVNMSAGRHIVQVLKVGWNYEPPHFVMEYLESGSLEELIRSNKKLTIDQCVHFIKEIAQGLEFAHSKGVIHCDLKPANVLLDHTFQPRIADFGQGRMAGDQTPSLGTLFYMAPEQALVNAVPDVKWDVYALGSIAYTLLAGSPPYRSSEMTAALETAKSLADRLERYRLAIVQAPRPKLHYRCKSVDKALAQIVDRCLHVDPNQRFQNAQQVIGALEQRQRQRNRFPLYLLGLLGPIVLMALMLMFSARSRGFSVAQSEESVVQRSIESNQFAARYASRTLETEIQTLFSLVEDEAHRDGVVEVVRNLTLAASEQLKDIAEGGGSPAMTKSVRALREQVEVEKYLKSRLDKQLELNPSSKRLLNSAFVNDAFGTNLGIVFRNEQEKETAVSPVGQNFAYRSYFTGQRLDGKPSDDRRQYRPTTTTSLSASFRSTSTGIWKIAVSAPIWPAERNSADSDGSSLETPIGVLVLTINLGDFVLLSEQSSGESPPPRFATLFDGRAGNQQGTVLHHPFISKMDREKMKTVMMPQLSAPVIEDLIQSGISDYRDPVSKFEGGEEYDGDWIATASQVELPSSSNSDEQREKSDLWVLVQERKESVSQPIRELAKKLEREILLQFAVLLSVVLGLWYFVFRLSQNSTAGGTPTRSESGNASTEVRQD